MELTDVHATGRDPLESSTLSGAGVAGGRAWPARVLIALAALAALFAAGVSPAVRAQGPEDRREAFQGVQVLTPRGCAEAFRRLDAGRAGDEHLECVEINKDGTEREDFFLSFDEAFFPQAHVRVFNPDGTVLHSSTLTRRTPLHARILPTVKLGTAWSSAFAGSHVVVVGWSKDAVFSPFRIEPRSAFLLGVEKHGFLFSVLNGVQIGLTVLLILAACIFRRLDFALLSATSVVSLCLQWSTTGQAHVFLWPDAPWFKERDLVFFMGLAIVLSISYATAFLGSSRDLPRWHAIALGCAGLGFVLSIAGLVRPNVQAPLIGSLLMLFMAFHLALGGAWLAARGSARGRWYLCAHSLGCAGLALHVLSVLGVLSIDRFMLNALAGIGTVKGLLVHGLAVAMDVVRLRRMAQRAEEMELLTLRSQIAPHFMANAFNSLAALVHVNPERADEMICALASFQRDVAHALQRRFVSLGDEIVLTETYLRLEAMRFESRLSWSVECPRDVDAARHLIPAFTLQTMVENAIKHGAAKRLAPTNIKVIVLPEPSGSIRLSVTNEAEVNPSAAVASVQGRGDPNRHQGQGLETLRRRLKLVYGGAASFALKVDAAAGLATASVLLPDAGSADVDSVFAKAARATRPPTL